MASKQLKLMNDLYASIKERVSKPGLDLATNRDIVENLHLAAAEPEAVTYAEVDADGVPALWCIPQGSDPARVLLHSHSPNRQASAALQGRLDTGACSLNKEQDRCPQPTV